MRNWSSSAVRGMAPLSGMPLTLAHAGLTSTSTPGVMVVGSAGYSDPLSLGIKGLSENNSSQVQAFIINDGTGNKISTERLQIFSANKVNEPITTTLEINEHINTISFEGTIIKNKEAHEIISRKLSALSELKDDWASENSLAPTETTIEFAKKLAEILINRNIKVDFCYPLRNGGIQLEVSEKDNIEYEVHPNGQIHQLLYDDENNLIANTVSGLPYFESLNINVL